MKINFKKVFLAYYFNKYEYGRNKKSLKFLKMKYHTLPKSKNIFIAVG